MGDIDIDIDIDKLEFCMGAQIINYSVAEQWSRSGSGIMVKER